MHGAMYGKGHKSWRTIVMPIIGHIRKGLFARYVGHVALFRNFAKRIKKNYYASNFVRPNEISKRSEIELEVQLGSIE